MEVLFVCAANDNELSCTALDFRTGTNLITYKGGGTIKQHSFNVLGAQYVLGCNSTKPLLHIWPINNQEQLMATRFVLPGKVDAFALAPDHNYIVAGIQESLYIWRLTTGRMLNKIEKHYQNITCLCFTDDGSHFVSASRDGAVLVWNLTQVVARGDDNQTPLYSFSDHGLPVTDVYIGRGGMRSYLYTVALDRSCKVYDLSNGSMLLNVVFAEGLHCVLANALESSVYVGCSDGTICQFNIGDLPRTKEYHMEEEHTNKFVGHELSTAVNSLALSLDGHTLISGGQDGQICVWYIPNKQLLNTIKQKGAITNLYLRLSNTAIFNPEHKQPHIFCGNLQRMIAPAETLDDETIEILITEENAPQIEWTDVQSTARVEESVPASKAQNSEETNKIQDLQDEIKRLKAINRKLFLASTQKILDKRKTS